MAKMTTIKRGMEKGIAKIAPKIHKAIGVLIKMTSLTNIEIAEPLEVPISLVEKIRQEIMVEKKGESKKSDKK